MSDAPTRGERNRNPGNIILDQTNWLGLIPSQDRTDTHFCQFDSDVHGIRALCKILLSYQRLDGCKTLRQMIARWAPPSENNTDAYVADVAGRANIDPDAPIDVQNGEVLAALAKAIIHHENGRVVYDDALIERAATIALS